MLPEDEGGGLVVADVEGGAVVVGAVLVEVAGGAAAFEGTAVGEGVELGVARN